jgi:hypothetical protein
MMKTILNGEIGSKQIGNLGMGGILEEVVVEVEGEEEEQM